MEVVGLCSFMAALTTVRSFMQDNEERSNTSRSMPNPSLIIDSKQIVEDIISNTLEVEKPTNTNIISRFSNDEREEYFDDMREVKSLCTEIVTNELLQTKDNIHIFVSAIVRAFEDSISLYKKKRKLRGHRILFLYKSGNILRMLSQHFLNYIPNYDILREEMQKYFKKGDCDFCIYINPIGLSESQFKRIHKDMTTLSYVLNVHLRDIFMSSLTDTFQYFNFTKRKRDSTLRKYVELGKGLECFQDPSNKRLYNKTIANIHFIGSPLYDCPDDQHISFTSSSMSNIVVNSTGVNENGFIYVQCNRALRFHKTNTEIAHFNLIRSKVNFDVEIEDMVTQEREIIHIGGELIDISIPHYEDKKMRKFFRNVKRNVHTYTLENPNLPNLAFSGISLSYNIKDLEEQIFGSGKISSSSTMPWEMKKYEKRIHRLLLMYFMDLFKNKEIETMERMDICIKRMADMVKDLATFTDISEEIRDFNVQYPNVSFVAFFKKINNVRKHVERSDYDAYMDMLELIIKDLLLFDMTVHNNIHFCNKDNRIYFSEDLYVS